LSLVKYSLPPPTERLQLVRYGHCSSTTSEVCAREENPIKKTIHKLIAAEVVRCRRASLGLCCLPRSSLLPPPALLSLFRSVLLHSARRQGKGISYLVVGSIPPRRPWTYLLSSHTILSLLTGLPYASTLGGATVISHLLQPI
jgi:hypothetical protein